MTTRDARRLRLAVLGKPIAHSRSPLLHRAAYRRLGLDWDYDRAEVGEHELGAFLESRGEGWRGMSLTMPLKSVVIPMCRSVSAVAQRAGAVNTIVFDTLDARAPFVGHNTDVAGVRLALDEVGTGTGAVEILGGGNTASSVILACAERGATELTLRVRAPERARDAADLAESLGLRVRVLRLDEPVDADGAELVVNTIPGGTDLRVVYPAWVRASATLLDAIYDPWPTALAAHWLEAGGTVVSGLDMLLHQAVAQVRLFVRPDDGAADVGDNELVRELRAALAERD